MSLTALPAEEVIRRWAEFDTVIDARSEGEFDEDHLPGAINAPVLSNEERVIIGTMYKQVSPFEATRLGAAMVARRPPGPRRPSRDLSPACCVMPVSPWPRWSSA